MLEKNRVDEFHNNGFLLGDQILNDDEVKKLQDELDRIIMRHDELKDPQPVRVANLSFGRLSTSGKPALHLEDCCTSVRSRRK